MRVFLFLNNKTISTKNNSDIKSISDKYKKRTAHCIFDLEDVRVISQDRSAPTNFKVLLECIQDHKAFQESSEIGA